MTPNLIPVTLIILGCLWALVHLVRDASPLTDVAPHSVLGPEFPWWLPMHAGWVPARDPSVRRLDASLRRWRAVARDPLARQNGVE